MLSCNKGRTNYSIINPKGGAMKIFKKVFLTLGVLFFSKSLAMEGQSQLSTTVVCRTDVRREGQQEVDEQFEKIDSLIGVADQRIEAQEAGIKIFQKRVSELRVWLKNYLGLPDDAKIHNTRLLNMARAKQNQEAEQKERVLVQRSQPSVLIAAQAVGDFKSSTPFKVGSGFAAGSLFVYLGHRGAFDPIMEKFLTLIGKPPLPWYLQ
jgi:hypothetical protein